jgi:hypothetical protein
MDRALRSEGRDCRHCVRDGRADDLNRVMDGRREMLEASHVSGALNDRSGGRCAVALAAAFMAGGYLGSIGSAVAGDEPGGQAGSSGRDRQSVTCYEYWSPRNTPILCNAVGGDGEDGASGMVHR